MTFPPPIPCPTCGNKASVHIYFKAFICYRCNTLTPLTPEELEACFRVIPAEGRKSLVPPEKPPAPEPEPVSISLPAIERPFPLEMPRPEHKSKNPLWSGIRFPGDFIRIFDYELAASDTYDTDILVRDDVGRQDPQVQMDDEEAKDAFIRLLREKCRRKIPRKFSH